MVPVAPASRSAIRVIDSSPSNGPAIASPPAAISGAACRGAGHFDLEVAHERHLAREANQKRDRSVTPLSGASCTMIGIRAASATFAKCSIMPVSSARSEAP